MTKIDPFTRTPGVAGQAYIDNGVADEIINNFCSEESNKCVYKITGLRGSGKSVEYSKVIRAVKEKKYWLVYTLSAAGDAIETLIAKMNMESFLNSKSETTAISSTASLAGQVLSVEGEGSISVSRSFTDNDHFYSQEAVLTDLISRANKKKYKVLIGIDDISKTPAMVKFLSIFGSMILEGLQVYLVVTGLSQNIEEFSSERNLTFFKRADSKEIKTLNKYDIVYMYEKLLKVDTEEAKRLQELSRGYAYAYQVLGSLYFSKKDTETLEDILPDFDRIMFRDSYDLIWKDLTQAEKDLIKCIYRSKTGKTEDIKALMKKPGTYSVYRDRLINKHIVDGDVRGYLKIQLPRFDKFIEIWG